MQFGAAVEVQRLAGKIRSSRGAWRRLGLDRLCAARLRDFGTGRDGGVCWFDDAQMWIKMLNDQADAEASSFLKKARSEWIAWAIKATTTQTHT